jgi:hypothetical protein
VESLLREALRLRTGKSLPGRDAATKKLSRR